MADRSILMGYAIELKVARHPGQNLITLDPGIAAVKALNYLHLCHWDCTAKLVPFAGEGALPMGDQEVSELLEQINGQHCSKLKEAALAAGFECVKTWQID